MPDWAGPRLAVHAQWRPAGRGAAASAAVPASVHGAEQGAVTVAKTNGFSATVAGTVLPPATPARIRWNMSPAYSREQEGHSLARRLPQRTWLTPMGSLLLM